MKFIVNKHTVLFDSKDIVLLGLYPLKVHVHPGGYKQLCYGYGPHEDKTVSRVLLQVTDRTVHVDHKDGNSLNLQRLNMRLVSNQQNSFNSTGSYTNQWPKGVSKVGNKFVARIMVNGKSISLGNFFTSEGASAAYKRAANIFFKEYALHNSRETT